MAKTTKAQVAQGYEVWRGLSPEDGSPIVLLSWGYKRPSANPKTGPMIQFALVRADMSPAEASKQGLTGAVCNRCPYQAWLARLIEEVTGQRGLTRCYVGTHQGINESYKKWARGGYPKADLTQLRELLKGKRARMGTYGNFSNVPLDIVRAIAEASDAWTLYEHAWAEERVQGMRQFAMASVGSLEEKEQAKAMGWRTFRVMRDASDVQPDEVVCPASEEAGKKVTCFKCRLCCGTERQAKSVVIMDHGPTSRSSQAKRQEKRRASQQAKKDAKRGLIGLGMA